MNKGNKAAIIIDECTKCPNMDRKRVYTPDSFEHVECLTCKISDNKTIHGYFEWRDTANIPDWCPIKVVEKND